MKLPIKLEKIVEWLTFILVLWMMVTIAILFTTAAIWAIRSV